jgi:hypothetical protein
MKLTLSLGLAAVLAAGTLLPTAAQAASKPSHREANFRVSKNHHHHHRHSKLIRVWVRGHMSWHRGHRHWVPGHYEWRRVYYWS